MRMRIPRALLPVQGGVTASELFAMTIVAVVFSHALYYFYSAGPAARIPDRILLPVFLVSAGYNSGRAPGRFLWGGAIVITAMNAFWMHALYIDILGVIVLIRLGLDRLMVFAVRSKVRFWAINLLLFALFPLTFPYAEYGTLAVIMAMAGWINRNRGEVPESVVKPHEYFIFAWLAYLIGTQVSSKFVVVDFAAVAAGSAYVMILLYHFRRLLLNDLAARPRDEIGKFCRFLGHKSLEIYVVHLILFECIIFYLDTH